MIARPDNLARTYNFMIDETLPTTVAEAERASDPVDPEAEVERRAAEESVMSAPKRRTGGLHPDVLPGEVGPCTRCAWVWTPSSATLRNRPFGSPLRCANCRSDYWQVDPVSKRARRPGDPEFALRRDTIANRKKRRKVAKLKELASELNVELVNDNPIADGPRLLAHRPYHVTPEPAAELPAALDMTPRLPWQSSKPRTVIPPPPGMDAEDK